MNEGVDGESVSSRFIAPPTFRTADFATSAFEFYFARMAAGGRDGGDMGVIVCSHESAVGTRRWWWFGTWWWWNKKEKKEGLAGLESGGLRRLTHGKPMPRPRLILSD